MSEKITPLEKIGHLLEREKREGKKIVHCHGVFDLLHPGHIKHLLSAKRQGDKLVVSVTPDRFVNKGPGRPVFSEHLRVEQLASIGCVDYVVLNDAPDAVSIISKVKPDLYVKGKEYQEHDQDITGKISEEADEVAKHGGAIYYTDDIVFSSSNLLNRFLDEDAKRLFPFIERLKNEITLHDLLQKIDELSKLNVLVVGDAIIDEYQYVEPLGQSGKGIHMAALCKDKEIFLGGSLIIANHIAQFAKNVTLLTSVGKECASLPFIESTLDSHVSAQFLHSTASTLTKKRYVLKDGPTITKLFETYSNNERVLSQDQEESFCRFIEERSKEFDLILVCDFGNGFITPKMVDALSNTQTFLAINTQTNSGNRGFHVVTHYHRADFISLNEPEIRLAAHDRNSSLESIVRDISEVLHCPSISVTRGVNGVYVYSDGEEVNVPALTMQAVDRVGAGDSYFSLTALSLAKGLSPLISAFLGSVAAAIDVQIVGNREAVKKVAVGKFVTRLLK